VRRVGVVLVLGLLSVATVNASADQADSASATQILLLNRSPGDDCSSDIYSVRSDGSDLLRLTNDSPRNGKYVHPPFSASFGGDWSPDGSTIVYTRERTAGGRPYETACIHGDNRDDLFVMRADGSGKRSLTTNGSSGDGRFSPDGTKLAFVNGSSLLISDLNGKHRRVLGRGGFARWSPDGSRVAFDCGSAGYGSCVFDFKSGRKISLGTDIYTASWAADSETILFDRYHGHRAPTQNTPTELWSVRWDGSQRKQLTQETRSGVQDQCPVQSPDASAIAFTRTSGEHETLALLDTQGVRTLVRGAPSSECPAWSRGGSLIAFGRGRSLWVVNSDGSGAHPITTGRSDDSIVAWRP
jgi:Tol biopolymer transport system component